MGVWHQRAAGWQEGGGDDVRSSRKKREATFLLSPNRLAADDDLPPTSRPPKEGCSVQGDGGRGVGGLSFRRRRRRRDAAAAAERRRREQVTSSFLLARERERDPRASPLPPSFPPERSCFLPKYCSLFCPLACPSASTKYVYYHGRMEDSKTDEERSKGIVEVHKTKTKILAAGD